MMRRMKKILRRLSILVLAIISFIGIKTTKAVGYMYSSDGKIIESSAGYSVTEENIFNTLSDSWKNGFNDETSTFNSPSDLYIYKDEITNEETIYIVDSESNKLYIFNKDLVWTKTVSRFPIDPGKYTIAQLSKIKTATQSDSKGTLASTSFWTADSQRKYESVKNIPFANRTSEENLYIDCYALAGIYRGKRPLRDANYKIVLYENEQTVYEDILCLCDTKNRQILILNPKTFEVIQIVSEPEGVNFTAKFEPVKMVVDSSGRMYVISTGVYEGILLINYDGSFMTFVGVNYTTLSFWDALKRSQKTEEQLAQETTILQTSFNNLTIDKKGFLYTVSGAISNADGTKSTDTMIKKINSTNSDVLKRNGYNKPIGDLITIKTGANAGSSNFAAITVNEYGVYTVADTKGNKLFTYDNEGNLLYISGGSGQQVTDIKIPVAVAYQGENLLVLDKGNKCVMRFKPTDFAKSINKAVYYEYIGDADKAADEWQNVIHANPAYELAYVGVGKKLYEEGRYQEAMLNFEKGADVKYFSRAYKMYRDDIIGKYFPYVGGGILILIALNITLKVVKKAKKRKTGVEEDEL